MSEVSWSMIEQWVGRSTEFFVKKLSPNDTRWADFPKKYHQSGPYVPVTLRESGYFPEFEPEPGKPHILRTKFRSLWPQADEVKLSTLTHYTKKGTETHLTWVPRHLFRDLTPASLLVGGVLRAAEGDARHWFIVVDSESEAAEILETALDMPADFQSAIFPASHLLEGLRLAEAQVLQLIAELRIAIATGKLREFIRDAALPDSAALAMAAQAQYIAAKRLSNLDPFALPSPGDAIMEISRDIEYEIYKQHELRRRAGELAQALLSHTPDLANMVVRGFPDMYGVFISASQQRKTRAGLSFERHIGRMLRDGNIRFQEQVVTGGRRPDFVLPDVRALRKHSLEALVLSCKTTLKERWKQVIKEQFGAPIFLATVDDRVAYATIDDMERNGIVLVVPESMKRSEDLCYRHHGNAISFKHLFEEEIKGARPVLIAGGFELVSP